MPRLKKYSQTYDDDSVSRIAAQYLAEGNDGGNGREGGEGQEESVAKLSKSGSQGGSSGERQGSGQGSGQESSSVSVRIVNNKRGKDIKAKQENKETKQATRRTTQRKSKQTTEQSKYNADQILKKMQEQCAQNQQKNIQDRQQRDKDSNDACIPDQALFDPRNKGMKSKSKGKKGKNTIKSMNKFFNIQVQDIQPCDNQYSNGNVVKGMSQQQINQLKRLQQQHKNLSQARHQKSAILMQQHKNQITQKVTRIRQRLQFKNPHQDIRFKEHMKQALDNVKDCQEVEIHIDAPKIFRGSCGRQADAALFIRNMSQKQSYVSSQDKDRDREHSVNSMSRQLSQNHLNNINNKNNQTTGKKIDRKQFYQQFTQQVKQTRAIDLPTSTQCIFKKSSLQDLQSQFDKNQHLFKESRQEGGDSKLRNSGGYLQGRGSGVGRSSGGRERQQSNLKPRRSVQRQNNQNSNTNSASTSKQKISQFNLHSNNTSMRESINKNIIQNQINIINQQKQKQNEQSKDKQRGKFDCAKQQKEIEVGKLGDDRVRIGGMGNRNNKIQQVKQQVKNTQQIKNNPKKPNRSKSTKKPHPNPKPPKKRPTNQQKFHNKIKQLFELQASEQTNAYGDNNGHSSQQSDNQSVESLIDRQEVKLVEKHERQARKKLRDEQWRREREIFNKIKERILVPRKIKCQFEESSQSRRRRVRRLEQAKKRFKEQDGDADSNQIINLGENQKQQNSNQNESSHSTNFSQQLKNLQQQLANPNKPQPNPLPPQKNPKKPPSVLHPGPIRPLQTRKTDWKQINILTKKQKQKQRTKSKEQADSGIEKRGGFINLGGNGVGTGVAGARIAGGGRGKDRGKVRGIHF